MSTASPTSRRIATSLEGVIEEVLAPCVVELRLRIFDLIQSELSAKQSQFREHSKILRKALQQVLTVNTRLAQDIGHAEDSQSLETICRAFADPSSPSNLNPAERCFSSAETGFRSFETVTVCSPTRKKRKSLTGGRTSRTASVENISDAARWKLLDEAAICSTPQRHRELQPELEEVRAGAVDEKLEEECRKQTRPDVLTMFPPADNREPHSLVLYDIRKVRSLIIEKARNSENMLSAAELFSCNEKSARTKLTEPQSESIPSNDAASTVSSIRGQALFPPSDPSKVQSAFDKNASLSRGTGPAFRTARDRDHLEESDTVNDAVPQHKKVAVIASPGRAGLPHEADTDIQETEAERISTSECMVGQSRMRVQKKGWQSKKTQQKTRLLMGLTQENISLGGRKQHRDDKTMPTGLNYEDAANETWPLQNQARPTPEAFLRGNTSGADCKASGADCKVSGADCKASGADCKVSGADCKASGADCKASGADCSQCRSFYDALKPIKDHPAPAGFTAAGIKSSKLMLSKPIQPQSSLSKHQHWKRMPPTPPGYWEVSFPPTARGTS